MTQQAKRDIKVLTIIYVTALILGIIAFACWFRGVTLDVATTSVDTTADWLTPVANYPTDDNGNYIIGEQENFTLHNPQSQTVQLQGVKSNGTN